jgi:hypothetical protein
MCSCIDHKWFFRFDDSLQSLILHTYEFELDTPACKSALLHCLGGRVMCLKVDIKLATLLQCLKLQPLSRWILINTVLCLYESQLCASGLGGPRLHRCTVASHSTYRVYIQAHLPVIYQRGPTVPGRRASSALNQWPASVNPSVLVVAIFLTCQFAFANFLRKLIFLHQQLFPLLIRLLFELVPDKLCWFLVFFSFKCADFGWFPPFVAYLY